MKKTIIITLIALFSFNLIEAKTIDYEQAGSIAKEFMERIKKRRLSLLPQKAYYTARLSGSKVGKIKGKNGEPYYIFNIDGGGWVIVTDDDINSKIIAYSEKGFIDKNNLPPQFKWWLKGVSKELIKAKKLLKNKRVVKSFKKVEKAYASSPVKQSVGPLLRTAWGQGAGYNDYCPYDPRSIESNKRVPAGCVATAMAQIMNYFAWPPKGRGKVSYVPPSNPHYGVQSVDFEHSNYSWNSSEKSKIIYHAGVAVKMDYTPYGSGSYLSSAADALREHFYYNNSGLIKKSSDEQWDAMLINSLSKGYPVLYQGKGDIVHVFVCDGYKKMDDGYMYHFNWGWKGKGNGWFRIGGMSPISDYSFNKNNYAVFNIHPSDPSYNMGTKEMKASFNFLFLFLFFFIVYRGLRE